MGLFDQFFDAVAGAVENGADVVSSALGAAVDTVVDATESGVDSAATAVSGLLGGEAAGAVEAAGRGIDGVLESIRTAGHDAATSVHEVGELGAGLVRQAGDWLIREGEQFLVAGETRIVGTHDDTAAESVPRLAASGMSIAAVRSSFGFRDSGPRTFFSIAPDGSVTASGPDGQALPPGTVPPARRAISYTSTRRPQTVSPAPKFDMIAANGGRIFAKERGRTRFYFTMLGPMFLRNGALPASGLAVPSAYFKLDPEQGSPTANNADRLAQLPRRRIDHPAAFRFPFFRLALETGLNTTMAVTIDPHLGVWHLLDARPPSDAPDPPSGPLFPPLHPVVEYQANPLPGLDAPPPDSRHGYLVRRVLDIGVGHEHWHEQASAIHGGELDSLDGPGLHAGPEILIGGRDVYRLFNGPIDDKGGFIDGTINYYVLAEFLDPDAFDPDQPPPNAYGILWIDEQAALSERWRLLHPDDSGFGGFRDLVPSALVQYLARDAAFDGFHFDRSKFWCPFRDGCVRSWSRMAVSRQVVVVSGCAPGSDELELYSINFSFGTGDRTWRRRLLGPPALAAKPPGESGLDDFGLREDMTLWVRAETHEGGRYWFQGYLPADGAATPDGTTLELPETVEWTGLPVATPVDPPANAPRPDTGFTHPWQTLPADTFDEIHARFSTFGAHEPVVDSRSQYYLVDIRSGVEALRERPEATAWLDLDGSLFIDQSCVDWTVLNDVIEGRPTDLPASLIASILGFAAEAVEGTLTPRDLADLVAQAESTTLIRHRHHRGLFNPRFLVKLLHREPLGWILVHWDKRDDDLLPFFDLGTKDASRAPTVRLAPSGGGDPVSIALRAHRRVAFPPVVSEARVSLERGARRKPATAPHQLHDPEDRRCARREHLAGQARRGLPRSLRRLRTGRRPLRRAS